jgi:single-strand DNA-binding protein
VEGELRSRDYDSKKTDAKQRVWEIRVASIVKLDRAEKATPEDQDHDEVSREETARINRSFPLSEARLTAGLPRL